MIRERNNNFVWNIGESVYRVGMKIASTHRTERSVKLPTARLREYKPLTNGAESTKGFRQPKMKWTDHRGQSAR